MAAETLLLNAAIGGVTSAVTGGDPLKGALLGAVGGGVSSAFSGALGGGTGSLLGSTTPAAGTAAGTTGTVAGTAIGASPTAGQVATQLGVQGASTGAASQAGMLADQLSGFGASGLKDLSASAARAIPTTAPQASAAISAGAPVAQAAITPASTGMFSDLQNWWGGLKPAEKLLYGGGAGLGALMIGERLGAPKMPEEEESELKKFRYRVENYRPSRYLAEGGIASLAIGGDGYDRMVGDVPAYQAMASGGISDLGSYSDGGRMLRGPGDGMSDNIPGVIAGKRPARLADGEFVVPADVVSHLGNGSTDAGAKQLYAMMDRVRKARTGTKQQGRQIRAPRMMPA